MTHRITTIITSFTLAGVAILLALLQGVIAAAPAQALAGNGHGPGYLSADGWWLGTYRLDDGAQGFCLNAGKPSPTGHALDYQNGDALGWFTAEQAAKLAYIARAWAGTNDRLTAAAGQLATWQVAGLGGHTLDELAARAGADAGAVLARAQEMTDEAARKASTGVHASAVTELGETGPGRLRTELTVDRLTGPEVLPPGTHSAHVTLDGATFADGGTAADIPSGTDVAIVPAGSDSSVSVSANAIFDNLPYGTGLTIAVPRDDAQAVLVAVPATAHTEASTTVTGPSPLPFQPHVTTMTSATNAAPGARIADHLTVTVEAGDGLLPTWGVRTGPDGLVPVEAVVESTLLGPFADPIVSAPTAPKGAPEVCTVETRVTGPGEYETPTCELTVPGNYVWIERIDPARTPSDQGGLRIKPWVSSFGVASEVTRVEAPALAPKPPAPAAPAALAETGTDDTGPGLLAAGSAAMVGALLLALQHARRRHRLTASRRSAHGRHARQHDVSYTPTTAP